MGWSVGRGCSLPTEEGVWRGGCSMCSKNFCVQAKGGRGYRPVPPPPKYATGGGAGGHRPPMTGFGGHIFRSPDSRLNVLCVKNGLQPYSSRSVSVCAI